jgi:Uma2 family endonuclease
MTVSTKKGRQASMPPEDELHYPSGDGKPMAENDICRDLAIYCTEALGQRYARDPHVYVAGNNFIYYQQGNPKKVISPDVYVVFGVEKRRRRTYMVWNEGGRIPSVVIEITSATTWAEDTKKRLIYESMGVTEYFQFDPSADYLYPQLQGFRLVEQHYHRIEAEPAPTLRRIEIEGTSVRNQPPPVCLRSEPLGLYLVAEGDQMRFYDAETGEPLLSGQERAEVEARRADAEAHRAEVEAAARAQAEAELVRLRAELEELRRQQNG